MGLTMQPCGELHYSVVGFYFYFFDFLYVLNIKNKPKFSIFDNTPVISTIFPAREDLRSKPVL